jgi:putative ABC transport system substrate-binding protein
MRRREFIAIVGGATVGWPFAAHTQQSTLPVIGFMSSRSPDESADVVEAFRGGVMEGGVIEGQNAVIEFRWAHGDYGRLPSLAADLVSSRLGDHSLGWRPLCDRGKGGHLDHSDRVRHV